MFQESDVYFLLTARGCPQGRRVILMWTEGRGQKLIFLVNFINGWPLVHPTKEN